MRTIQDILSFFELTDTETNRLSKEAKHNSIGCGKIVVMKDLLPETWKLFNEMSDIVWYSNMANTQKILLGFELFEFFPSYYHFLIPFYRTVYKKDASKKEKEIIWRKFSKYLIAEKYYADPVEYVLWVEFFEDPITVKETWKGLLKNCLNNNSLLRLLEIAGPVPFNLKEPIYNKLIIDKKNHEAIFNSLLNSAFDVFGQIDKKKACIILSKLRINTKTENYILLKEKLT